MITDPPVVAHRLARLFDFDIVGMTFGLKHARYVAGFIDIDRKEIVINAKDDPVQQNFTIAHGLGHYVLEHHKDPSFETKYSVILRDACFVGQTPVELEVNLFADNLLVPSMFLQKYLNKYPYATDQELSTIFGVPPEVIRRRRLYV